MQGFMLGEHRCAMSMDMLWPCYGLGLDIGHRQYPWASFHVHEHFDYGLGTGTSQVHLDCQGYNHLTH